MVHATPVREQTFGDKQLQGSDSGRRPSGWRWRPLSPSRIWAGAHPNRKNTAGSRNRATAALDSEVSLEECPAWAAFREACEVAERIDSFLAAAGRGAQGAGLAADCRECLDTLRVLADKLEHGETSLPLALSFDVTAA